VARGGRPPRRGGPFERGNGKERGMATVECPGCGGTGSVMARDTGVCGAEEYGDCPRCGGRGEVADASDISGAMSSLVRRLEFLGRDYQNVPAGLARELAARVSAAMAAADALAEAAGAAHEAHYPCGACARVEETLAGVQGLQRGFARLTCPNQLRMIAERCGKR